MRWQNFSNVSNENSTVWSSKIDHRPRNMLLIKNPQFLPNFYDTLSKCPTHELVILAKCHKNWVKIVDLLLIAYFWAGGQFCWTILYVLSFFPWLIPENVNMAKCWQFQINEIWFYETNFKLKIIFDLIDDRSEQLVLKIWVWTEVKVLWN